MGKEVGRWVGSTLRKVQKKRNHILISLKSVHLIPYQHGEGDEAGQNLLLYASGWKVSVIPRQTQAWRNKGAKRQ